MPVEHQILAYLQKEPKHSFTPRTLHRIFKEKILINTIRQALRRLEKKGKLIRETHGYYRAKMTADILHFMETPPTLLHGIKLECQSIQKLQNTIEGITSQNYNDTVLKWFDALGFTPSTNYRYGKELWFDSRRIKITVHLKGLIEIFINSTKNPLSYPEFCKLLDYLNGYLEPITPFDSRNVRLVQVGAAKDYYDLRMEGVSCISLHKFVNDWSKIYYKDDINATRIERHLTCNIQLDEALNTLSVLNGSPTVNGNKPDERIDVA